eukprot:CAMPEP_0182447980 /NCGR_PEP_ID=MMETSP1172-20130603/22347_1 /TAXON_ID=708627 /ORGANISM="Timspurckia oligopyrenoides, Strain CCMP3278" /LENGTH=465 /DNA_ID=CAMNT_0024644655 /DNA_START=422 /DNA_END=1819 /DNA_ORIENTATION=+
MSPKTSDTDTDNDTHVPSKLDCIGLNLHSISHGIFQHLPHLIHLNLSRNQLTQLPSDIDCCINLQTLNLMNNKLKTLPESVSNLSHLQHLGLKSNQLVQLPEHIGNLSSLIALYITDNRLEQLPQSMNRLKNLRKLQASCNRLNTIGVNKTNEGLELMRMSQNEIESINAYDLESIPPKLAWTTLSANPITTKTNELHKKASSLKRIRKESIEFGTKLGNGASGHVYESVIERNRRVAVKMFDFEEVSPDGSAEEEIQLCCKMIGACVDGLVQVCGVVVESRQNQQQQVGIVMEIVDGQVLGERPDSTHNVLRSRIKESFVKRDLLSRKVVIHWSKSLVNGLMYLHESLNICHGDVYAHNMIVSDDLQTIVLCDFGGSFCYASCLADSAGANETASSEQPQRANIFQVVEIRAFGIFLEELLMHLKPSESCLDLAEIAKQCTQTDATQRISSFSALSSLLNNLAI